MERFKVEVVDRNSKWFGYWGIVYDFDNEYDLFYVANGTIGEKDYYALVPFGFDQLRFVDYEECCV